MNGAVIERRDRLGEGVDINGAHLAKPSSPRPRRPMRRSSNSYAVRRMELRLVLAVDPVLTRATTVPPRRHRVGYVQVEGEGLSVGKGL